MSAQERRPPSLWFGTALTLLIFVAIFGFRFFTGRGATPHTGPPTIKNGLKEVLSWPRMKADAFGCKMEKEWGIRDAKFNCALTHYQSGGDPCKNPEAYYEGPSLPDDFPSKLHPLLQTIQLSWEHGELQAVSLFFKESFSRPEMAELFGYHMSSDAPNIMDFSTKGCSKEGTCVTLQGFDHEGAGDVDCDE